MIDLWHAIVQTAMFTAIGLIGMVCSYVKKWLFGEIEGDLIDYMFRHYPKRTALAVLGLIGSAYTAAFTGNLDGLTVKQITMMAIAAGYACNSMMNKGQTP
jgi:hypothetical protein